MANIQNLTNMGKGRPRGSRNKLRITDVLTDDVMKQLLEELIDIGLHDKYAKNRIAAATYLVDRIYGKVPSEVNITTESTATLKDLFDNNGAVDNTDENL